MLIDIDLNILDSVARAASDIADDVSGTSRSVNSASENVNAAWRSDTSQIYVREIEGVVRALVEGKVRIGLELFEFDALLLCQRVVCRQIYIGLALEEVLHGQVVFL